MIELHRILIPTDFSKFSQIALVYATAFAEKFAAELYLLHVVQDLAVFIPDMITVAPPPSPTVAEMTRAVHDAFDRIVTENQLERFTVHRAVREWTRFY